MKDKHESVLSFGLRLAENAKKSSFMVGFMVLTKVVNVHMSVEETILYKVQSAMQPTHLEVINESHGHNVAPGSETHFKLVVVSESFKELRSVARHQMLYKLLSDELAAGVHALALHTYTLGEWQAKGEAPVSPSCMGGAKK